MAYEDQATPHGGGQLTSGRHMEAGDLKRSQLAEEAMQAYQPTWRLSLAFFDNHQFAEINAKTSRIIELETAEGSAEKPRWLQRTVRNRYTSGCVRECALLTSRAPVFECTPRGSDFNQGWAAKLGEQGLLYLYEHLALDTLATGRMIVAANCGASYLWPYWNDETGQQVGTDHDGSEVYEGDIAFVKLQPDEVMWEPGYDFDEAPVHIVKRAYPMGKIKSRPNYIGPENLEPDARSASYEFGDKAQTDTKDCVFVYDWLERPCRGKPNGRWLTYLASGEQIQPERPYPRNAKRSQGKPVLHELAWLRRDHRHRPLGAGELAIDIQRTRNRTINQILMWKNLVLNPRMLAPYGSIQDDPTGKPGEIVYYRPVAGHVPSWQQQPDVPQTLFQTVEQCDADLGELFGSWDMPDTESAQHLQTAIEKDRERRALQGKEVARWWAGLGQHLIELMQEHYVEERLVILQGRYSVDRVEGFKGAKIPPLMVRVASGSVEAKTRAASDALAFQLWQQGAITVHELMTAINSGSTQMISDAFEAQVAKQARENELIAAIEEEDASGLPDMDSVAMQIELQHGVDSGTAAEMAMEVLLASVLELGPQVGPQDDDEIHAKVLTAWMVTVDYERKGDLTKAVAQAHLEAHQARMAQKAMEAQLASNAVAEQAGEQNAARPAGDKPEPSRASMDKEKAGMT